MTTRATFAREHDGATYVLSDDDVNWLARSLWGEGGHTRKTAGAIAWCMFRRYFLWPGNKWESFTALIRAFSEPVNPNLYRNGDFCKPPGPGGVPKAGKFYGTSHCKEEKFQQREMYRTGDVPFAPKTFAEAFAQGQLPEPSAVPDRCVNFAQTGKTSKPGVDIGGNHFIGAANDGLNFLPGDITVSGGGAEEFDWKGVGLVGFILVLIGGAVYVAKKWL